MRNVLVRYPYRNDTTYLVDGYHGDSCGGAYLGGGLFGVGDSWSDQLVPRNETNKEGQCKQ